MPCGNNLAVQRTSSSGKPDSARIPLGPVHRSIAKSGNCRFTGVVPAIPSVKDSRNAVALPAQSLCLGEKTLVVRLVRHPRARRYILRLCPDGSARVTIPRGGTLAEARVFLQRQTTWLKRQVARNESWPRSSAVWKAGSTILFRGEQVVLEECSRGPLPAIRFATETVPVDERSADLRPAIEAHLWRLGTRELPPRLLEYAAVHGLRVSRVSVRNQRTRWGSCSQRGCVSLNWRLVQTPPFVRDYICLHELMHLREMNHSRRFWAHVESVCPYYHLAERWLKAHARLLH
jgi:predicted metal-dependent hydrolase